MSSSTSLNVVSTPLNSMTQELATAQQIAAGELFAPEISGSIPTPYGNVPGPAPASVSPLNQAQALAVAANVTGITPQDQSTSSVLAGTPALGTPAVTTPAPVANAAGGDVAGAQGESDHDAAPDADDAARTAAATQAHDQYAKAQTPAAHAPAASASLSVKA